MNRVPKPAWLKVRPPGGQRYATIKGLLRRQRLHTVCEEARCPNVGECWNGGTATFMVLGDVCTRGCRFCAVKTGHPNLEVDSREPLALADAVATMGLDYVVLTMVDRDDLADGGASHVARCVGAIKRRQPEIIVEALVGDFAGDAAAIETVCDSGVEVLAHNIETVQRLQRVVRDRRCGYTRSLEVLAQAKAHPLSPRTKSSIMLGLGEREEEILQTIRDLRAVGTDFLTLGQYLQPGLQHLPVREFVDPSTFARLRDLADAEGFLHTASGPLVRSSYRAGEFFIRGVLLGDRRSVRDAAEPSLKRQAQYECGVQG